jgi:predicted TIM-barrel fold metal-dependent hydrolase
MTAARERRREVATDAVEATLERRPEAARAFSLIDCDVHPMFRDGLDDLGPYLTREWRHRLGIGETPAWARLVNGASIGLPKNEFYRIIAGASRGDTWAEGMVPGSDPQFVARQLLDEYGTDRAILLGGPNSGLATFPHPDAAATLASAYNEWLSEHWLAADDRYRGAILVAPQDPELAAAEIDRVGDRPGVVAVHMPMFNLPAGERHYHPIYAAAQRHGLPILAHPAATEGIYVKAPQMAAGVPTFYMEWHTLLTQPHQANVVSLVCHGVFEEFPELKYVIVEGGFAWAVDVLWRLDRDWKALRDECPWVKKRPSEYVFDHVRFTTQPFYEAKRPEHIHALCEILEGHRTLLFSSDYPHWDFDDPRRALKDLPKEIRQRVFVDNALETFGERLH